MGEEGSPCHTGSRGLGNTVTVTCCLGPPVEGKVRKSRETDLWAVRTVRHRIRGEDAYPGCAPSESSPFLFVGANWALACIGVGGRGARNWFNGL